METIVAKVDGHCPSPEMIEKAANLLRQGGLVAFPTETVYGLGANGLSAVACKKIYEAKGRPSDNPLILHIANEKGLEEIVSGVSLVAKKVMDAFWPGPITLVFPKKDIVPKEITGGFETVAVRFPSHAVAQALILAAGMPIAAPSANSSGKPSPTTADHVIQDLNGKIDMVLDGGATTVGLESTILDVTGELPMILRPGAITKEMLESIVGTVLVDPSILEKPSADLVPKAPGMKYTHYSPKADVILVRGALEQVQERIVSLAKEAEEKGRTVGILATDQTKASYSTGQVLSLGNREELKDIAANLFRCLRAFDTLGVEVVFSEVFTQTGEGMAIMNRLQKAAGYQSIDAEDMETVQTEEKKDS